MHIYAVFMHILFVCFVLHTLRLTVFLEIFRMRNNLAKYFAICGMTH